MKALILLFLGILAGTAVGIGVAGTLQRRGWIPWLPVAKTGVDIGATTKETGTTTEFFHAQFMREAVESASPDGDLRMDDWPAGSLLLRPDKKEQRRGASTRLFFLQDISRKMKTEKEMEAFHKALVDHIHSEMQAKSVVCEGPKQIKRSKYEDKLYDFLYRLEYKTPERLGDMHIYISAELGGLINVFAVIVEQTVESPFVPVQPETAK